MPNQKRRRRRAKQKSSPNKNSPSKPSEEFPSLESEQDILPMPSLAESEIELPTPPPSPQNETPTKDAVASMSPTNLYHLSLVCFSFSLILFASTYQLIVNNGGTTAVFSGKPVFVQPEVALASDASQNSSEHDQLLIGYKLLHHTLKKESQLKYLHLLRDATFRGPKGSLKFIMTTVHQTSKTRFHELEDLFVDESPKILLKDTPKSAMSKSIQENVEKSSTKELVPLPFSSSSSSLPRLQWGLRFIFVQAQATRMVVALATSLSKFEANKERKQWLYELADEFEGIRETLVESTLLNLGEESWNWCEWWNYVGDSCWVGQQNTSSIMYFRGKLFITRITTPLVANRFVVKSFIHTIILVSKFGKEQAKDKNPFWWGNSFPSCREMAWMNLHLNLNLIYIPILLSRFGMTHSVLLFVVDWQADIFQPVGSSAVLEKVTHGFGVLKIHEKLMRVWTNRVIDNESMKSVVYALLGSHLRNVVKNPFYRHTWSLVKNEFIAIDDVDRSRERASKIKYHSKIELGTKTRKRSRNSLLEDLGQPITCCR